MDNVVFGPKIMTDEYKSYKKLDLAYRHDFIAHSEFQHIKGDIHTNTIESFWAIVKRAVYGVYHRISVKYLQTYINEFSFRYNNRNIDDSFDLVLKNAILV